MQQIIQNLKEQRVGASTKVVPQPFPYQAQEDDIKRESLILIPNNVDGAEQVLSTIETQPPHQLVVDTGKDNCLMEWNLAAHLLKKQNIIVQTTARRQEQFLFFDHRIIVQCNTSIDLVKATFELINWPDQTLYYNVKPISFPVNYSISPLEYGVNFARVSTQYVSSFRQCKFFVSPRTLPDLYKILTVPGCVLGSNLKPNVFYKYDFVEEVYLETNSLLHGNSFIAHEYTKQKLRYLKMLVNNFPNASQLLGKASLAQKNIVDIIQCPQEMRVFLTHDIKNKAVTFVQPPLGRSMDANPSHLVQSQVEQQQQQQSYQHGRSRTRKNKKPKY